MSESDSLKESILEVTKDRLTNRLYMYMFSSVVVANFQHILLILMSKNDIELTLGLMAYEDLFYWKYFIFPILIGSILSIVMPYLTRLTYEFTASQYYIIKNSDKLGQSALDLKISKRKEAASEARLKNEINKIQLSTIKSDHDALESQSRNFYKWLKGLLKAHEEVGGKIENDEDFKRFLFKLHENGAVYDGAIIPGFKKLMQDLHKIESQQREAAGENDQ
ncbi:hypothetical protein [Pantoea coffeiphila]|uniref:hypothetical protein n=1 Tax=Pantoea coffeiphila TaxID=1465635 RepID=UPI00195FCB71|nr:hypothetical protein [Pantoea coffeiphila]MBM7341257.1 hypothetical protein [Pantoea coffeiphila]